MNQKQLTKGAYGEQLVIETMAGEGWEHRGPCLWWGGNTFSKAPEDTAHTFDHVFIRGETFLFGDSKAKAKTNVYQDQGINLCHFDRYWNLFLTMQREKGFIDFRLFFIDESPDEERIYYVSLLELQGAVLKELQKEKKTRISVDGGGKPLIFFASCLWHDLRKLTVEEVSTLRGLCRRNYGYAG